METNSLLAICLVALIAVFILLGVLAIVIKLITSLFPVRSGIKVANNDAAVMAAIASTVAAHHPSARIAKIEEQR